MLYDFRDLWMEGRFSVKVRKHSSKALPRQHRLLCVAKSSLLLKVLKMRLSGHVLWILKKRILGS